MSGQIYARWVPPPKAKSKPKPTAPAGPPVPQSSREPREADTTAVKQKKKKEKKERSKSITIEESGPVVEIPKVEPKPTPNDTPSESPKTRKKSKKRKRESNVDGEAHLDNEAIPKKHKSILSKYEQSSKRAEAARSAAGKELEKEEQDEKPAEQLHDLVPIPQPAPVPDAPFEPTYSALPSWLAKPITVDSSKTVPFSELGVHHAFLKKLKSQGFEDALAVQSVLLPMLHPGFEQHLGDMCVSARTGSGKTLAYLLPIIEALRDQAVTALSAIVVVPSRQLVDQALKVAEELCTGTKLKVGTALGSTPFATEQQQLVKLTPQYDPSRARELHEKAEQQLSSGMIERGGILDDLVTMPENHIPEYDSGVDILICTPGRLVEHIESTTGFLLRSVRWLVIDEADQLLTQNFQGWTSVLMEALHSETPEDFMSVQERLRKKRQCSALSFALPARRQITKVVLSATMKKDLTQLGTLRLRRPKLVVVEGGGEEQPSTMDNDVFELPSTLDEFAIPVGDGSNKPLYLLYFLLRKVFTNHSIDGRRVDSDLDLSSSSESEGVAPEPQSNRVLIFVKSNENASRLSHLLSILQPSLEQYTKTMTKSATSKQSQKLLRSFGSGKVKILIASDAASRGLDIPDIAHVVNYDIPSSITSYVHRVGRTARAGKEGQAWTFFTKTEAGWFWHHIATGGNVKRGSKKVARVEFRERDVTWDRKRTYQEALKALQGAVEGADPVV